MYDDEDETTTLSVGKYPVMPSLVALQQMKNRLHLAMHGKKVMSWQALATGKELRHIGADIEVEYSDFAEKFSNAFMELARCRYYERDLNIRVIEGSMTKSAIALASFTQNISSGGRKVLKFDIVEVSTKQNGIKINLEAVFEQTGVPAYHHMCIGRGGNQVQQCKAVWRALITKLVEIIELRDCFDALLDANLSATKRQNILGKLVIPKTQSTIKYILLNLEEAAREEKFRIKRIVEYKARKKIFTKEEKEEPAKEEVVIEEKKLVTPIPVDVSLPPSEPYNKEPETMLPELQEFNDEINTAKTIKSSLSLNLQPVIEDTIKEFAKSSDQLVSEDGNISIISQPSIYTEPSSSMKIDKEDIKETQSDKTKMFDDITTIKDTDTSTFPYIAHSLETSKRKRAIQPVPHYNQKEIQEEIKRLKEFEKFKDITVFPCQHRKAIKEELQEILKTSSCLMNSVFLDSDQFAQSCNDIKKRINAICDKQKKIKKDVLEKQDQKTESPYSDKLSALEEYLQDVVKTIGEYKTCGIFAPGMDDFLKTCRHVKSNIEGYRRKSQFEQSAEVKLASLEERLQDLKNLLSDIITNVMKTSSMDSLLYNCNNFLVETTQKRYKLMAKSKTQVKNTQLHELRENLRDVIALIDKFHSDSSIPVDLVKFLKCCKETSEIIALYEEDVPEYTPVPPQVTRESENKIIDSNLTSGMQHNFIDKLSALEAYLQIIEETTVEYQKRGMKSEQAEIFLKSLHHVLNKIDGYKEIKKQEEDAVIKLTNLEKQVAGLKAITCDVHRSVIKTNSIDSLLAACRQFNVSLEDQKRKCFNIDKKDKNVDVNKLRNHIDGILDIINNLSHHFEEMPTLRNFLKICQETKNKVNMQRKKSDVTFSDNAYFSDSFDSNEVYSIMCPSYKSEMKSNSLVYNQQDNAKKNAVSQASASSSPTEGIIENQTKKIITVTRTKNKDGSIVEKTKTVILTNRDNNSTVSASTYSGVSKASGTSDRSETTGVSREEKCEQIEFRKLDVENHDNQIEFSKFEEKKSEQIEMSKLAVEKRDQQIEFRKFDGKKCDNIEFSKYDVDIHDEYDDGDLNVRSESSVDTEKGFILKCASESDLLYERLCPLLRRCISAVAFSYLSPTMF